MEYSMQQRIKIIKIYWENKCAMEATIQKLEEIFGAEGIAVPKSDDIRAIEQQFLETGSVRDQSSDEEEFDEEEQETEEEEEDDDEIKVQIDFLGQNDDQIEPDVADR